MRKHEEVTVSICNSHPNIVQAGIIRKAKEDLLEICKKE